MTEAQAVAVVDTLDNARERFTEIALSIKSDVDFMAERGYAAQLLNQNSRLRKVAEQNPNSLLSAIVNVASIGLSLNPAGTEAYLITRYIDGRDHVRLEPSYMGLCNIATRSGRIEWVQAKPVYANDTFELNRVSEEPTFRRQPFGDRGDLVGVFCVAKLRVDAGRLPEYLTNTMTLEEINGIRDRSESWKAGKKKLEKGEREDKIFWGPWKTDYVEMAKKAVVRQAFKMWPKTLFHSPMLANAVNISNENEGFEPLERRNYTFTPASSQEKIRFHDLLEAGDALTTFCFYAQVDEGAQVDLYNDFDRGEKGNMQKYFNKLRENGQKIADSCMSRLVNAWESDDDSIAIEILEEAEPETWEYFLNQTENDELVGWLTGIREGRLIEQD